MNTLIEFSDAPCHLVSARRSTWPRSFRNASREQLAEIGRAFTRGDKRAVDRVYEELKATSLRGFCKTVSPKLAAEFLEGKETLCLSTSLTRISAGSCLQPA
jgi:hypothetical protein